MHASQPTALLLRLALREISDDAPCPALVELQQRATREVFDAAVALLPDEEPDRRELGLLLLRELGEQQLPGGRRPFSDEAIPLLRRRLREEDDPEVLRTVISALGYNGAREALPDVLDLAAHPHDWVRFAVAAALPSLVDPAGVEPAAADALLALSADDDAETRYYAFYAILLEVAGMDPTAVGLLATRLGNDPDAYIRSMATAHQAAITRLTARFRADPDEKIRTIATDHPEAIIEVRRLLNVWDYLGIHEVGKDTDEHDRLIGPLLRALADNLDATALQQVLDHQLRSPTDTWTEGLTTSLLGWWRTVR
ncbi:HEAT repeat domain-containing protein [Paractinoplanes durhamensis]|uniref:HEAT repeat domain-containing protein n=1 Tax=Paractinoplanes durhamensis TaxID=113563 RepID=A0ABQ3YW91_9ACTN|nr:HEAT repeat domain-containing protein [Actinoplanes durhamensis]GIE01856.1 hypothetical protein Adu01nite_32060 [Actinoplanes durhamensis]